jgi:uncharacterized protein YceK
MKRILNAGLILMLCFTLGACGTIAARTGDAGYNENYYKGTHFDLTILGLTETHRETHGAGLIACIFMIVCPFIVIASVPVDLAIDTLLLPADYYQHRQRKAREEEDGQAYSSFD